VKIYEIGSGMIYFEPETDPQKIEQAKRELEVMLSESRKQTLSLQNG
jgi:hypothetical protein